MTALETSRWRSLRVVRTALVLAFTCLLAGNAAVAQPQKPQAPPQKPQGQRTGQAGLQLNDREYFETRGLNVLVFTNQYNGMFFDEKTAGIEIIQHGVRLATGGAVRLSPTPEQWDQIPKVVERKVDKATNTITCVLRYEAFDFDSRLVVTPEGTGVPRRRLRRQAGAREARGPGGAQPRVPAVDVLRADVPRGRQARDLPALSHRADRDQVGRHEDPPVRGLLDVRRPGPERVRGGPPGGRRQDVRPRARGPRAPHRDSVPLRRPPVARRAQPRPERLVHRPLAADGEDDGKGGGMAGPPERHSELDADAGHRLLAGRLSPDAEEGGGHRARSERHGPSDRVPVRGDRRRRAGRAAEGEGPALGAVPPVQVRHGGLQRREPARPLLHPVRQAADRDVPDRPERLRHHLARDVGRLVPRADGPHDGERGLPRLARTDAHGRRAAGPAELPALRRLPDGGDHRHEVQAPRAHPGPRRRRLVRRRRLRHPGRLARGHAHDLRGHLGDLQAAARPDVHRSGHALRRHPPPGRQARHPAADRARRPRGGGPVPEHRPAEPGDRRFAAPPVPPSR